MTRAVGSFSVQASKKSFLMYAVSTGGEVAPQKLKLSLEYIVIIAHIT